MTFVAQQVTHTYTQRNEGTPEQVFPLLCPVREKDWLDGWEYEMIYSQSGLIEKDCVFSTPYHGDEKTIWQVTQYHPITKFIEFVRVTPHENVVKINIQLEGNKDGTTSAHIAYQHTALNPAQNTFIENELSQSFQASMAWWEKAINHYLKTGEMLKKG